MLRIVTGPFHPTLEQALVEDIRRLKSDDPSVPLAVIVPSSTLAVFLKRLLVVESQCPFLNIHILTFHQLALRLREDLAWTGRLSTAWELVDDVFFEQVIRQVVQRKVPDLAPLERLPDSPGTWKGLWATVRDLKDAAVPPVTALQAVSEGLFEESDRTWLQALFALQGATLEAGRSLGVGSPDDLAASLGAQVSEAPFLRHLDHIYYFGFYDLSQVQLSLFETITSSKPATLYYPLESTPAYGFARRFFDRYLSPQVTGDQVKPSQTTDAPLSRKVELSVVSVVGTDEELATVCREILTLAEVHGYAFDEIGVVGRTLEPYQHRLQAIFDQHLVPFTTTAQRPILREPLAKLFLRLASLPLNQFEQSAVLDVLTSPWYRIASSGQPIDDPRPDLWRQIVSTLGITKGQSDWDRLAPPTANPTLQGLHEPEENVEQAHSPLSQPKDVHDLWRQASELMADCKRLPELGTVHQLTDAFLELTEVRLMIPGWSEAGPDDGSRTTAVATALREALARLRMLDPVRGVISWEAWYDLFFRMLDETTLPIEGEPHRGVQVFDAMTARGLRFRALFLIGMNEQSFPRYVREDPFLRDRQRVVLESTLGFKIDEKLAGYDEERLLFALLSRAATHRLYLTYQRADEDGRAMVPSGFVASALRDERFIPKAEISVPRRLIARLSAFPTNQDVVPAQDLAIGCLLQGESASPVLKALGKQVSLLESGQQAQVVQERESPDLGPYDGLLPPRTSERVKEKPQSLSPTSLERYATCPFRYFSEQVLRLEPVPRRFDMELPAMTIGTLLHETLRLSYEQLLALQWPDPSVTELHARAIVTAVVREVFAAHAAVRGTGHALLWTIVQEQIEELVLVAVASDQTHCRTEGFRPHAFEVSAKGSVALGPDIPDLQIQGTIDRIDLRTDPPATRIVDYKFKQGSEMKSEDRNLLLSAIRGARLQPPLYASMALPSLPSPSEVQLLYLAPRWKDPIQRATFETSVLRGQAGRAIITTLRTLVQGIARREFFILPDSYCEQCSFSTACRRFDQATWWRSYRAPQARSLRRLRKAKVSDE